MIVLAAGQGRRMNRSYPKMLISLKGKPLLHWTLQNLESCSAVDAVIVTVPSKWRKEFQRKIRFQNYRKFMALVNGGQARTDSTRNAIQALPKECEMVGIHDAARPFPTASHIKQCFDTARRKGAAILAVPATDTVKRVSNNLMILGTIPREQCWTAQTPQIFKRKIAEKIHGAARGAQFTDDASIAEFLGHKVAVVRSSYENIKVTTPNDLLAAEMILNQRKSS